MLKLLSYLGVFLQYYFVFAVDNVLFPAFCKVIFWNSFSFFGGGLASTLPNIIYKQLKWLKFIRLIKPNDGEVQSNSELCTFLTGMQKCMVTW